MTELITIAELIGKGSFCIPKYQRGYRWTQDEVKKLLNDIYEFNADETNSSEYYCLQPIVVKKNKEGEYWIVDGQQRITTISLILGAIPVSENLQKDSKIIIEYEVAEVADNNLDTDFQRTGSRGQRCGSQRQRSRRRHGSRHHKRRGAVDRHRGLAHLCHNAHKGSPEGMAREQLTHIRKTS